MEQESNRLFPVCCLHAGQDREQIARQDRRGVDSVLTDEVLEALRAQGAPGCLLCWIDEWEENEDA